jgi:pSer/pThr/pTyr-binding forkhead associated (FHA) protein
VAEEKRAPQSKPKPSAEADGAMSGEYLRQEPVRQGGFSAQSTTRRKLDEPQARNPRPTPSKPPAAKDEEQTLRSAKVPQPVRMSLRMRRVAAGTSPEPQRPGVGDRLALRLGGRLFELPLGERALAGRGPECQLVMTDRLCSRRHAEFSRGSDGDTLVCDLGSSNGTYVNGIRIAAARRLAIGDWITIGNETFELCIAGEEQRAATPTIPVKAPPSSRKTRDPGLARAKTDPGSPLLSLASFTAQAVSHPPTAVSPAAAEKPLRALLLQAQRGERLDGSAPEMAALVALRMASVTQEASWLSYCFQLYGALRLPLSPELIDRLREALLCVPQPEGEPFRTYLEQLARLEQQSPDAQRAHILAQLNELRGCFD